MMTMSKKDRQHILDNYWLKSTPHELEFIDKGDHLQVQSGSSDVAAWWLGTLRAVYPQDHYGGSKDSLVMHPDVGVTLKLNRSDGTLKIKGKKHLQWFKDNFDHILESGNKDSNNSVVTEFNNSIDRCLRLDDGFTVSGLLEHLPPTGAVKHGPSYIYRLWKGLLDQWISGNGTVYIIAPLVDAKRLADVIMLLMKHRLSRSRVLFYTMQRCDGEIKFPKVYKAAQDMIKDIRTPNKKRLVADERLKLALQRVEAKFSVFQCKMVAVIKEDYAEIMTTSASFHKWHFELDHCDTLMHFKMPVVDFNNHYLDPLGLAPRYESPPTALGLQHLRMCGIDVSEDSLPPPPPPLELTNHTT